MMRRKIREYGIVASIPDAVVASQFAQNLGEMVGKSIDRHIQTEHLRIGPVTCSRTHDMGAKCWWYQVRLSSIKYRGMPRNTDWDAIDQLLQQNVAGTVNL